MAEVWWPTDETSRNGLGMLKGVPFLITDDGNFPEGVNYYLYARSQNIARPSGSFPGSLGAPERPAERTLTAMAYDLADLLTWGEDSDAHPSVGRLAANDIQEWHIRELYVPLMREGFWSQRYFETGHPHALAPYTIQRRANLALNCYRWMHKNGYDVASVEEPDCIELRRHRDAVLLAHIPSATTIVVRSTGIGGRRNPALLPLPTRTQLLEFFNAIEDTTYRLIANLIFECGLRVSEAATQFRLPDGKTLRYEPNNLHMLGVIPSRADVVRRNGAFVGTMPIRIRGKGEKLRTVEVVARLLLRIWRYIDSANERGRRAERFESRTGTAPERLFLNTKGHLVSSKSIQAAFRKASDSPLTSIRLTPHELRHAFAVYFLESAILREAHDVGIPTDNIPPDFFHEAGSRAVFVLMDLLGHANVITTQRYLAQLSGTRLTRALLENWQNYLDSDLPSVTRY